MGALRLLPFAPSLWPLLLFAVQKPRAKACGQGQAVPAGTGAGAASTAPASRKTPRRVSARSKNELLANDVNHQVSVAAAV